MSLKHILIPGLALLVACGGGEEKKPADKPAQEPAAPAAQTPPPAPATPPADAGAAGGGTPEERGKKLFNEAMIMKGSAAAAGCMTCHKTDSDDKLVGPSLKGLKDRAGTRVAGLDAQAYIRQSILEPNAFVNEGFAPGLMPQNYKDVLAEEDVNALVAYLMSL